MQGEVFMNTQNLFISATEARNNFFALLEKVKKGPYPVNITVKGIPEVVIMSKEDFDGWIATIETLSDSELMAAIRQGDEDIKTGRYKTLEQVEKELGIENYLIADKGKKIYVSRYSRKSSRKRPKKA